MAKYDKRTAPASRAARVRRATTRSWGVERLEERTVLSAAGSALLIYVVDLSDVRGWEPPMATKAPTQGNSGPQKSVVQLDHATIVFVRGNAANRRGPSGGEDGPEGESSGNAPANAALKLRAPEPPSSPTVRAPEASAPPTTPQLPACNRETPASSNSTANHGKEPESPVVASTPVIQAVAPATTAVPRPTLLIPETDSSSDWVFTAAGLDATSAADALWANRGEQQVLGQSGLLHLGGNADGTKELADPQMSYETDSASDSHAQDGMAAGDEVWQLMNRTKRLRRSTPMRLQSVAVHAALQQLICQFPSTETWALRMDIDPATELAKVLTAEVARSVAVPRTPQVREEEGGAVTLSVEEFDTSMSEPGSATDSNIQNLGGAEVVSLQDVEVRMEFSAKRYQAFDVSTEPTQATDPSREVAVDSQATGD